MLRESQPLRVYATRSIRRIIMENNIIFAMVRNQITWNELVPGREFDLTPGIRCLPFALAGNYPHYVDPELARSLAPEDALLGLRLESASGKCLIYMPGAPSIEESWLNWLKNSDLLLFDGTFWTDDELIRVQGGGRTARQMGHMPVSGVEGSLARLADVQRPRKIYIHVNNTNPMLDEESAEYRSVCEAGWEVAHDGMEFEF